MGARFSQELEVVKSSHGLNVSIFYKMGVEAVLEKNIRVSVAMATYNGGMYLRQQMDSILEQLGENAGFPFDLRNVVVDIAYQKEDVDCVIPANLASNVKQLHDFLYGTTSYTVTESVQSISDEIEYRTGISGESSE